MATRRAGGGHDTWPEPQRSSFSKRVNEYGSATEDNQEGHLQPPDSGRSVKVREHRAKVAKRAGSSGDTQDQTVS